MQTIKFKSKQPTYQLSDNKGSIISNPVIEPKDIQISWENQVLRIPFRMSVLNAENEKVEITEGSGTLIFGKNNIETKVDYAGVEKEIETALQAGWTYDKTEVIKWGHPRFQNAMNYFQIDAEGLKFVDSIFGQIGLDYVLNNVMIEGKALKEHFELIIQ